MSTFHPMTYLSSTLISWLLLPALLEAQLSAAGPRLTFEGGQVPIMAVDPFGPSMVVWNDLLFRSINLRTFDAQGQSLARAFLRAPGPEAEIFRTDVATAGSGTFALSWVTRAPHTADRHFIRLFDQFGRRSAPIELAHPVTRLDTNRHGDAVGIWGEFRFVDFDLGRFLVRGRRLSAQGVPLGRAFSVRASNLDGGFLDGAEVAIDERGRFVVIWRESAAELDLIHYFFQRYRRDGTKRGAKRRVSREKPNAEHGAVVDMDPSGDFVVVWDSDVLQARWFDQFGRPLGDAVTLSGPDENPVGPAVKKDRFGNTVILWSVVGGDSAPNLVLARVFDPMGDPVDEEVVLGPGLFPSFGLDDEGGVVVTWSHNREGQVKAIVQRFALTCVPPYEQRCHE